MILGEFCSGQRERERQVARLDSQALGGDVLVFVVVTDLSSQSVRGASFPESSKFITAVIFRRRKGGPSGH